MQLVYIIDYAWSVHNRLSQKNDKCMGFLFLDQYNNTRTNAMEPHPIVTNNSTVDLPRNICCNIHVSSCLFHNRTLDQAESITRQYGLGKTIKRIAGQTWKRTLKDWSPRQDNMMVCGIIIISKAVQCVFEEVCIFNPKFIYWTCFKLKVWIPCVAWTICKVYILVSFGISLQISSKHWSKIYKKQKQKQTK